LLARSAAENNYTVLQSDHGTPDLRRYRFVPELWAAPTSFAGQVRTADNSGYRAASPGEQAALNAIVATAVKDKWTAETGAQCPNAPDAIRGTYCLTTGEVVADLRSNINGLAYADMADPAFTAQDFKVAQQTFSGELGDVADLRSSIAAYQEIYNT